jgi:hypothetical protein
MRRQAIVIVGALVALLAATAALAATRTYDGQIKGDPKSSVALNVKKLQNGDRQVRSFVAKDLLISCRSGEARLESAAIRGRVPVKRRGRFEVTGSSGEQKLTVAGKVVGKRKAEGTVHYSGPTVVDDELQACDSGKLDWVASR